jgi:RimJ/RimL family protein N-acetyltransferase
LSALVDACFAQWGMHRIAARSEIGNERAHHWLRRAGFQDEGTLRDASFFDNAFHDQLLFALLATDKVTTP